jgi:hypothetical protein
MNNRKEFKDVKPGDIVYHVTSSSNYKTSIIKREVTLKRKGLRPGTVDIICKNNGGWEYLDIYNQLSSNCTSALNKNTEPKVTYICTTLNEAQELCDKLVYDTIKRLQASADKIRISIGRWLEHQNQMLDDGIYNIK